MFASALPLTNDIRLLRIENRVPEELLGGG